jgi:hypothetical protein
LPTAVQVPIRVVASLTPSQTMRAELLADNHGTLLLDSPGPVLAGAKSRP